MSNYLKVIIFHMTLGRCISGVICLNMNCKQSKPAYFLTNIFQSFSATTILVAKTGIKIHSFPPYLKYFFQPFLMEFQVTLFSFLTKTMTHKVSDTP